MNKILTPQDYFEQFVNSTSFTLPLTIRQLGRILRSKENMSSTAFNMLDSDLLRLLDNYFDIKYASEISLSEVTKRLYGYRTGTYYIFISLYVSAYHKVKYVIDNTDYFLKYNVGVDEAWLFWPNIASYYHDISQEILRLFRTNTPIATVKKVHPYLIQEANDYIKIKEYLGEPVQVIFNKLAKYDLALAIAMTIHSLAYKIVLQRSYKFEDIVPY